MVGKSPSIKPPYHTQTLSNSDGEEAKVVIQQTAAGVHQMQRLSSNLISADYRALPIILGN